MAHRVLYLPEYEDLLQRVTNKRWVDFYLKHEYIAGSQESVDLLLQIKEQRLWEEQHSIGGDETKNEVN